MPTAKAARKEIVRLSDGTRFPYNVNFKPNPDFIVVEVDDTGSDIGSVDIPKPEDATPAMAGAADNVSIADARPPGGQTNPNLASIDDGDPASVELSPETEPTGKGKGKGK